MAAATEGAKNQEDFQHSIGKEHFMPPQGQSVVRRASQKPSQFFAETHKKRIETVVSGALKSLVNDQTISFGKTDADLEMSPMIEVQIQNEQTQSQSGGDGGNQQSFGGRSYVSPPQFIAKLPKQRNETVVSGAFQSLINAEDGANRTSVEHEQNISFGEENRIARETDADWKKSPIIEAQIQTWQAQSESESDDGNQHSFGGRSCESPPQFIAEIPKERMETVVSGTFPSFINEGDEETRTSVENEQTLLFGEAGNRTEAVADWDMVEAQIQTGLPQSDSERDGGNQQSFGGRACENPPQFIAEIHEKSTSAFVSGALTSLGNDGEREGQQFISIEEAENRP